VPRPISPTTRRQRLAERGLLREEDPIKLQRAVAEIAYSYARGGSAASGYVPTDSPLGPSQPLPEAMGWSSPLRDQYDSQVRGADGSAITDQANRNDADIRARQSGARVQPGKAVGNDVSGRVKQGQRDAAGAIEKGRRQVSEDAGTLSENYSTTVRAGKVSPNHGGNRAVWDTVGANAGTPAAQTAAYRRMALRERRRARRRPGAQARGLDSPAQARRKAGALNYSPMRDRPAPMSRLPSPFLV
jgi:hypothetical protein